MEILERVGVKIHEINALRMIDEVGAEVNPREKTARIPEHLVREALKRAPGSFTLYGRDPSYKLVFGGKRVIFSLQGKGAFVLDLKTGRRRPSTSEDVGLLARLVDALENLHHVALAITANDFPPPVAYLHEFLELVRNTRKTVDGDIYTENVAMDTVKMASIIRGGEDELRRKPMLLGFYNPVSPLQHSEELLRGMRIYAKYKQPILVAPECQAGATAPITLAGLLVQQNAEVLSGIALIEFTNPGTPVLYGTVSTVMDMMTGNIALGAIEAGLVNVATAQLARYYGLPSRGFGGTTESKLVDVQAGFEKAITLMMAALGGINFIYDAGGSLESTLTASYELTVVDDEICGMVLRALRGIEVDERTLALDVIERVGPGGHFLSEKHTLEHLRKECYIPKLIDRKRREAWEAAGSRSLRENAIKEVERILEEHRPEPLPPHVEKDLVDYVKRREREILRS